MNHFCLQACVVAHKQVPWHILKFVSLCHLCELNNSQHHKNVNLHCFHYDHTTSCHHTVTSSMFPSQLNTLQLIFNDIQGKRKYSSLLCSTSDLSCWTALSVIDLYFQKWTSVNIKITEKESENYFHPKQYTCYVCVLHVSFITALSDLKTV